jgi:hypothetical protein
MPEAYAVRISAQVDECEPCSSEHYLLLERLQARFGPFAFTAYDGIKPPKVVT